MKSIGNKESLITSLKHICLPVLSVATLFCAPVFADEEETCPETEEVCPQSECTECEVSSESECADAVCEESVTATEEACYQEDEGVVCGEVCCEEDVAAEEKCAHHETGELTAECSDEECCTEECFAEEPCTEECCTEECFAEEPCTEECFAEELFNEESFDDVFYGEEEEVLVEEKSATVEKADLPNNVTSEQIIECAKIMMVSLEDGFGWADLPVIMKQATEIFSSIADLDQASMKKAVSEAIFYIIDDTDTPWFPDHVTDPIMKALVPTFADIFFNDKILEVVHMDIPTEAIEKQDYTHVANLIIAQFDDGFQWKDLVYVLGVAIKFGVEMVDLPWDARGAAMKKVVNVVLEKTDTPYFPDTFSDPIFRHFAHSAIDQMVKSFKKAEAEAAAAAAAAADAAETDAQAAEV